jgi:DNA repair protein SbcC/Rad50
MRLKRLQLKNIRSYSELDIPFPEGSVLLIGDIGSGKTSILLGLQFGLFGLQPGQKGSSLLKNGEETAQVSLEMEIDGKEIIIERSIKKAKNGSISQESNKISIDEKEEELSTSEMRARMISLLNYPKEFTKKSDLLYRFTVYTPQEGMKEIINERPDVRLDLLRHIFGIERYKRIKENCVFLSQKLKENIKMKDILCSDISLLKERLIIERERKIKKTKENNDLSIELANLKTKREICEIELEKFKKKIQEKETIEREIFRKETDTRSKKILKERIEKEISTMKEQLSSNLEFKQVDLDSVNLLLDKHKNLREEMNSRFISINSRISILLSERENAIKRKEKVVSMENCPTCFQNVGEEHKEKISKKASYDLEEIDRELEPLSAEKDQIIKDIKKEQELMREYEKDKLQLEKDKIRFENMHSIDIKMKSEIFVLERIMMELEEIQKEIEMWNKKLQDFSGLNKLYEEETKKLQEILVNSRKFEITFAENKREIDLLMERIDSDEEGITKKEKIRADSNYLKELLEWIETKFLSLISFTERNVLVKIRQDFSRLFSEWFSMLVTDSLNVELDEDFTPVIYNQDYQIDYDFLSGGERTAVALAYRLSLNQMINSVFSEIKTKDLILLDEPTDGFSERQLDKVRDIFEQLDSKQIILVSHEPKIEGFVDNVIRVRKEDISRIDS